MYSVHTFDKKSGDMVFKLTNGRLHTINFRASKLTTYGGVNKVFHYFDTKNITIVRMDPPNSSKELITDSDGTIFRRANQFEFDRWMAEEFPESDNAKIYNQLIIIE
jgi:hypothetical protein